MNKRLEYGIKDLFSDLRTMAESYKTDKEPLGKYIKSLEKMEGLLIYFNKESSNMNRDEFVRYHSRFKQTFDLYKKLFNNIHEHISLKFN